MKNLKYKKKNRKRNKKFDQIKIELFFIKIIKKLINYELNTSKNVKVFSIFHVSFLKSIDSKIFIKHFLLRSTKRKEIRSREYI